LKNVDLMAVKKFHERLALQKAKVSKIGTILKQRRKELNLKQANVAQKIISVSHVSKIENNQTIPHPEILQLLMERLDLKEINIYYPENEVYLDEMMSAVFYESIDILNQMFEAHQTKNDISTQLLTEYHSAILNKDLTTTSTLSEKLKVIYRTFSHEEFIIWILGMMSEALLKHDYRYTIQISRVLNIDVLKKKIQKALFYRILYSAHMYLGAAHAANIYGVLLENEMVGLIHQKTLEMLKLTDRYYLIDTCAYTVKNFLVKDDYQQYLPEHHNLHALIQCELALKFHQPIPKVTPQQTFKDEWYYRLILFLAEHDGYDAESEFAEQNHFNAPFRSMYQLMQIKDPEQRVRFLKTDTLLMLIKHQESRFLVKFTDEIYEYLSTHSRYKEANAAKIRAEKTLSLPQ